MAGIVSATYITEGVNNTQVTVSVQDGTASSNTSSSSSTSGGDGVITDECFSNVQYKETRENDLRYGAYTTFSFTSDFPVYEVQVKGLKNEHDVSVRVEQLRNLSCRLTDKPQAGIYRYINIFSGVQQDGVLIKFKISNGWLSSGTVTLARWQDGAWVDLPTSIIGSDGRYTYYESESTGFSSFAILERGGIRLPTPQPTVVIPAAQVQPIVVPQPTEAEPPNRVSEILAVLAIIFFLGAATIHLLKKRCKP